MNEPKPSRWARISAGMTRVRLFISNLFFFGFLLFLLVVLFSRPDRIQVPDGGALILDPVGSIVEQRSLVDPLQRWLSPGSVRAETELQSVLDALERAREDERIRVLVLDFDGLQSVSTAHAAAIGDGIVRFRASGKEVIAYGASYAQQPYLMASAATVVYMHPLGQLLLPGYRLEGLYFKELLERMHVTVNVFRVGEFKEAIEPFIRSDMSPEVRELNAGLVGRLWEHYGETVMERRRLDHDRFERYTQFLDQAVAEAGGDLARLALEYHLVDELLTPDQARVRIGDKVGYDSHGDYRGIGFGEYLRATAERRGGRGDAPGIGVITAEGPIVMSGPSRGVIAADALVDLIRQVRTDRAIQALVLRIDTPGGSSFASELIRQELELLQLSGKPVVVSMGPIAASGGYWIAATADAIVAEPSTLTGSIGVFGILPTFENSLGALGIQSDRVATSSLSAMSALSGLSEPTRRLLQASTEQIYERFVNLVARGRELSQESVAELAEGRVWLGSVALDRGLVDQLGGRTEAIALAAQLAGIETWDVRDVTPPLSPSQQLIQQLVDNLSLPGQAQGPLSWLGPLTQPLRSQWALLEALSDPQHQYAICGSCTVIRGGLIGPW